MPPGANKTQGAPPFLAFLRILFTMFSRVFLCLLFVGLFLLDFLFIRISTAAHLGPPRLCCIACDYAKRCTVRRHISSLLKWSQTFREYS